MGLFLGIGIAYVVKQQFFGAGQLTPDFPMVEELSRERPLTPGRGREPEMVKTFDNRVGDGSAPTPIDIAPGSSQAADGNQPRPLSVDAPKGEGSRTALSTTKPSRPTKTALSKPGDERRVPPNRINPPRQNSGSPSVGSSSTRAGAPSNNLAMAVTENPRPTEARVDESASRPVSLSGLTYSRQLFNRCPDDCILLFRTADGTPIKTKLKKAAFHRVLSGNLSHVDMDGMETTVDGERVVLVRTIRGHAAKVDAAKLKEDKQSDASRLARTKRDGTMGDANAHLKSRTDTKAKKDKEPSPEEQEEEEEEEDVTAPSSFQDRLRRSVDK
jgi:hypothetical protein